MKSAQILQLSKLFQGMDDEFLSNSMIIDKIDIKELKKGTVIHFQNEACKCIEIIAEGSVEILNLDEDGGYFTMSKLYVGDIMGAGVIFSTSGKYPFTAVAETDVKIVSVSERELLDLCNRDTKFTLRLLRLISDKTDSFTGWISGISMKTIRQNVIDYLVLQASLQNSNKVYIDCTKKELAARFGVNRSSLGRVFTELKNEGAIDIKGREIAIKKLR